MNSSEKNWVANGLITKLKSNKKNSLGMISKYFENKEEDSPKALDKIRVLCEQKIPSAVK